jgi:hypothetical protein
MGTSVSGQADDDEPAGYLPSPRWWLREARVDLELGPSGTWEMASMAAQRTRVEPFLVMWPRWALASDSRCLG